MIPGRTGYRGVRLEVGSPLQCSLLQGSGGLCEGEIKQNTMGMEKKEQISNTQEAELTEQLRGVKEKKREESRGGFPGVWFE